MSTNLVLKQLMSVAFCFGKRAIQKDKNINLFLMTKKKSRSE
jgi:hypothetical protein